MVVQQVRCKRNLEKKKIKKILSNINTFNVLSHEKKNFKILKTNQATTADMEYDLCGRLNDGLKQTIDNNNNN